MIAFRIAVDIIVELWYKLHCLDLQVEPASNIIGDNLLVVFNTTLSSSKVKKKNLFFQIMRVQEAIAAGFVQFLINC